ncbi:MAG TPA: Asp-tRNA(Asn)/Glu-tRNA(Gln) amidotransferase subunit GatB [Actinomycetota bacterium]|jgi:aspartyl-tRNA(Asn)/glutamyl-tRNA(Gln) amidotransferase subunit B
MTEAATDYVTTIGLEIHVELKTRTKMFCPCEVAFGGEPNTRVCPICLGHPGTLPVPNERAIEYAAMIALAIGCQIAPRSIFHRKNYFYPDMPKNYQISQYDIPIGSGGALAIDVDGASSVVGITRAHLEEDTGKSIHVGGGGRIHDAEYSLEDYNRAGTPLVEIVTEPDMHSAEQARAFATELRSILEHLDVSDVRMEEGSLRIDANISVARPGERGVKTEVKNMNSIRSVYRALAFEEQRQRQALRWGEPLIQGTRHWDEKAGVTKPLRTKEFAFDYRYFPEPDLVPIEPSPEWVARLIHEMPDLPAARRRRLVEEFALTPYDAAVLTASRALGDFFQLAWIAAEKAEPKQLANWLVNDLVGRLAERGEDIADSKVAPDALAFLVDLVADGTISGAQGKEVLAEMVASGTPPADIVAERGLKQVSDRSELEQAVDGVLAANPDVVAKIQAGDPKPLGFLVGQVMRATKGQANPAVVNALLRERLEP